MSATDTTNTIPNCVVTADWAGQRGTFDIDPTTKPCFAIMAWIDAACGITTNIWADWYVDGCLVARGSANVSNCYRDGVGTYVEGQSCLPQLFVDVDNDFDPTNHTNDLSRYVPGSTLDGTSVAPAAMPQPIRLVAVGNRNVSGTVNFELVSGSVSKFPGLAMNYPIDNPDTGDDVFFMVPKDPKKPMGELVKGTKSSASFNSGVAVTTLYVNDYAAWASVKATIPTGRQTPPAQVTIRLPEDRDGNLLADAGWPSQPWRVDSIQIPAGDEVRDLDGNPSVLGQVGDGLSAFEEFRGFVVKGEHRRLCPFYRDLFVDMDVELYRHRTVVDKLPFNRIFVGPDDTKNENGTRTVAGVPSEIRRIKPWINTNRSDVPGARPDGQRALRIIYQDSVFPRKIMEDGLEHDVWKVGVAGFAFSDLFSNLDVTNGPGNPPVDASIDVKSVNETKFVEYYSPYFSNNGVHTNFTHSYYDSLGRPVRDCPNPPVAGCDIFDLFDDFIRPATLDGVEFVLNTVVDGQTYPDDYYTSKPRFGDCSTLETRILDRNEWLQLQDAIVGHEVAHGLDVPHNQRCSSLMYGDDPIQTPEGTGKAGMPDRIPVPTDYSPDEQTRMRTWEP